MSDVVIAGAGIAGSALAISLARQGRQIVLLDRARFPREKACGEGLMPAGVDALERLGVPIRGEPFYGIRYHHGGRVATGEFPQHRHGLGVRRWFLDAALLEAARSEPNVDVITEALVEAPLFEHDHVCGVRADGIEYRAPLVIAADGANSILRHNLGWDTSRSSRRHALRRHYRVPHRQQPFVDAYLFPDQETYVTPLPDNQVMVATLGDSPREVPAEWFIHEAIDAPIGASPLVVRATQRVAPGIALLGDAAGNCDPITGGGMAQALLSSELLAAHLRNEFPPSLETLRAFDRDREAMLASYRRLTAGVLALSQHPALFGPALRFLQRTPRVFSYLVGVAGGV
ncbi:MAG: NAD(P)/FAD-dependent oxidoreductase [Acidobacteriota bacterium]